MSASPSFAEFVVAGFSGLGTVLMALPALAEAPPAQPAQAQYLGEALLDGTLALQFRMRYEDVDQNNGLDEARARTLKSRLGYTTRSWQGWQAMLEGDNVVVLGDEDYNSTSNGETAYPVVADPDGTDLNQAWVAYSGIADTVLKGGRARLALDNERFVGGAAWRQNEQTFDGGSIVTKALTDATLTYAWIGKVHRVFGPDDGTSTAWLGDWDSDVHLLNASYAGLPFGTLTVYDYLMDIESADAQSNSTWGVRFAGKQPLGPKAGLQYTLEYAAQQDYADNAVSYDADYYALDAALALPASITLNAGLEVLEGEAGVSGHAFRTPLATLHKFQGWADMFLTTPDAGIEDRWIGGSVVVLGATASASWHDFEAEDGGASWGDELDLSLGRKFGQHFSALLKYADYEAQDLGVDTRKFWLQLQLDY